MRRCRRWAKATASKAPIGRRRSKPISEGRATGSTNEREEAGDTAMEFASSFSEVGTYSVETQFSGSKSRLRDREASCYSQGFFLSALV